jgi:hypothetical protein
MICNLGGCVEDAGPSLRGPRQDRQNLHDQDTQRFHRCLQAHRHNIHILYVQFHFRLYAMSLRSKFVQGHCKLVSGIFNS